jgi:S-DNA-T family DNA segregation ATPase FtsK/SpoIIIE
MPGTGCVTVDGIPEPVRVRFSYLDDDQITQLAAAVDTRPVLELVEGGEAA